MTIVRDKLGRFPKGQNCGSKNNKWKGGPRPVICQSCGKEFYIQPCRIKIGEGKYCSKKCYSKKILKVCKICKKEFWVIRSRKITTKYCSRKCHGISDKGKHPIAEFKKGQNLREKNYNWKGGTYTGKGGYVFVLQPNHPRANCRGYVRRSHLVMEKKLGRYLTKEERVHHRGKKYPIKSIENKQDDRIESLMLFPNESEHQKYHQKLKRKEKRT